MQHFLQALAMGLIMVFGAVSPVMAQTDCVDAKTGSLNLTCANEVLVEKMKAEGRSDAEIQRAKEILASASNAIELISQKASDGGELYVISEIAKSLIDLIDQGAMFAEGTGCKLHLVYLYSKDMNVYSKFWDKKSKLDNGYGLKQMGAIERTLATWVTPSTGTSQLRSKEYLGMIDRLLVEVREGEVTYQNIQNTLVLPLGETSCSRE
jgi:hypothetical protein